MTSLGRACLAQNLTSSISLRRYPLMDRPGLPVWWTRCVLLPRVACSLSI